MKLDEKDFTKLKITALEANNKELTLKLLFTQLQTIDEKIIRLNREQELLKLEEQKLKNDAEVARQSLLSVVEEIKTKYGLEDDDQVDLETGKITKQERTDTIS